MKYSESYYQSRRYRLSLPIKRKLLRFLLTMGRVVQIDYRHRRVGKTTMLIEKALEHNVPIVVGHYGAKKYIESLHIGQNVQVFVTNAYCVMDIKGLEFQNGVYIDESVSLQSYHLLKKHYKVRIRGGFLHTKEDD